MNKVVTYIVPGHKGFAYYVKVGDSYVWVEFTSRYCLDGCVYTTGDPEVQQAIEWSQEFRGGTVKVHRVVSQQDEPDVEAMLRGEVKEYEKVKTVQQAANVLVEEYGQAECDCRNKAAVLAIAKKVGVGFPNLK